MAYILSRSFLRVGGVALVLLIAIYAFAHTLPRRWDVSGKLTSSFHRGVLEDVYNSTLGFQKIFVINLPIRTDHRDAISLAAGFTGMDVEYVDGVTVVGQNTLPPGGKAVNLSTGGMGNWRAHMNVAQMMVEHNIGSALVLEDDADWDVRIKSQMRQFAKASRLLVQPVQGTPDQFLDPSYPIPDLNEGHRDFDINAYHTSSPTTSPYGDLDRWDIFWLGHCGCRFPDADDQKVPIGRAVIPNDETVPEQGRINIEFGDPQIITTYPPHTRVVSRAWQNTCTAGYAISLPGARKMLYELSVKKMTGTTDMMIRSMCHGSEGRETRICLSPQPQLFQHHEPAGDTSTFSEISEHEGHMNRIAVSQNIRWSTRVNFERLVNGRTDYIDSFPDARGDEPGFNGGQAFPDSSVQ